MAGVPGLNGITVAGYHVYLTNSARALPLRVPAAATDTTHLEIVAERFGSGGHGKPARLIRLRADPSAVPGAPDR
ncbi:hypothetical protein VT50_0228075 [Streptomyces antioxidans]|uniref:Uncharacterized protein n=1 Tax=Streptomyces antioxidans TaxID=1507734 RepID=A0A1V4CYG5_9ACTN|nr:hypothetical protein [Streptomyces antioxidans]OPF73810.1 hypothetical protein VT50_0228075 [Streptomyces antioxidans]